MSCDCYLVTITVDRVDITVDRVDITVDRVDITVVVIYEQNT